MLDPTTDLTGFYKAYRSEGVTVLRIDGFEVRPYFVSYDAESMTLGFDADGKVVSFEKEWENPGGKPVRICWYIGDGQAEREIESDLFLSLLHDPGRAGIDRQ